MTAPALMFLVTIGFPAAFADDDAWPMPVWVRAEPGEVGMDAALLEKARDYALTGDGSGTITRHGRLVMSWGDLGERYDLKSSTKAIGVTALGLALADRKFGLDDLVQRLHPTFAVPPETNLETGWTEKITIRHLATQTAGFEKPGGYEKLIFAPGTKWAYSDGGPNWLAECVTLAYRRDLTDLMFERVFTPIGIDRDDLTWRKNAYREAEIDGIPRREFGSGIHANVDAMARIGYLYLRGGRWKDKELIPENFVEMARRPQKEVVGLPEVDPKNYGNASDHYGLLWWNNADGTLPEVPKDAYWSWGLYDSLILVIPSLDIVVARAGKSWKCEEGAEHYAVLAPFFGPIVKSVREEPARGKEEESASAFDSPCPRSPVIAGIDWAPASTIVRKAKGGDNWPVTWADDGELYTAYGDGRGFEPFVESKLSMGLCRVTGGPDAFRGENVRSPEFERAGEGAKGPKVSSLLMIRGVLYAFVRNTGNSQLAWSSDRGMTWTWCDWCFETSFGYPAFLNFGRNYQGARDEYVYVYSMDSDSAYERADRMVLARVAVNEITRREAYEFFAGIVDGAPRWTRDLARRGAVFAHEGACYRSSISHSAPLRRYLWCQTGLGEDTRQQGGFAIYDAPEPWGPWTTVYFTKEWDVGPGETSCLPSKWMSDDGRTVYLVFSGNDSFSVRRGTVRLGEGTSEAREGHPSP